MFSNIGGKIKVFAKVLCVLEILLFFVLAIMAFVAASESYYGSDALVISGVSYLIVGPIAAWISTCLIYGFGELIEKTTRNEQHLTNIEWKLNGGYAPQMPAPQPTYVQPAPQQTYVQPAPQASYAAPSVSACPSCGNANEAGALFCTSCGYRIG